MMWRAVTVDLEIRYASQRVRVFERSCTCCLVAKLRGYCFAFFAVFREICDRREGARLLFRTLQTRELLRFVKRLVSPIISPVANLTRLTMSLD